MNNPARYRLNIAIRRHQLAVRSGEHPCIVAMWAKQITEARAANPPARGTLQDIERRQVAARNLARLSR